MKQTKNPKKLALSSQKFSKQPTYIIEALKRSSRLPLRILFSAHAIHHQQRSTFPCSFMDHFNEFFQTIIFVTLVLGVLWMCSAMFQLQYVRTDWNHFSASCCMAIVSVVAVRHEDGFCGLSMWPHTAGGHRECVHLLLFRPENHHQIRRGRRRRLSIALV